MGTGPGSGGNGLGGDLPLAAGVSGAVWLLAALPLAAGCCAVVTGLGPAVRGMRRAAAVRLLVPARLLPHLPCRLVRAAPGPGRAGKRACGLWPGLS